MRASIGTLAALKLKKVKVEALPTTAYFMLGEKCLHDCAFCSQARSSSADLELLSRVTWPKIEEESVFKALGQTNSVRRACFQVVHTKESFKEILEKTKKLKEKATIPLCVSYNVRDEKEARQIFAAGADHLSLPLDGAVKRVYEKVKGKNYEELYQKLIDLAANFPGKIGTHLIAGLGETEEEMLKVMADLLKHNITIALFAFTPIPGTSLEDKTPPDIKSYRRLQAAFYLLKNNLKDIREFTFKNGKVVNFGLKREEMAELFKDGEAFRTSGCPDCNRPYYNERPGGVMYNYPRPLTSEEIRDP
ncbi:radical SAM protein [Carboxydothermus pertinax]|uniref:biotin synthase n=1 Tax=Carboxydothermus pertinax TaxID=870242 RepID=A0A1L8CWV4_9THEO|nr:radical SAM protein [Carboxydothermus pertinax]GAV23361.1 radical SAM domain-containing protein [Carboxydothermus pertinax]